MCTGAAQRAGHQALVVPEGGSGWGIRVRGIEHSYAGARSGGERIQRKPPIGRQAHAAKADP
jgi:hypothetical protein